MLRALVIEDDALVRMGLAMLMESWGFAVAQAESTEEALARVEDVVPDILVSDYRLRGDDTGLRAIAAIRGKIGAELPALMITGETLSSSLAQIAAAKLPLMHKPVQPTEMRHMISTLLPQAA